MPAEDLVEIVARALADEPDAVEVDAKASAAADCTSNCTSRSGDLGRVIGRQGRTAAALRTLLAAAADVDGQRIQLDIRDIALASAEPPEAWDDMLLVGVWPAPRATRVRWS